MEEAFEEITPPDTEQLDVTDETHLAFLVRAAKERDDIFEGATKIFKTPKRGRN